MTPRSVLTAIVVGLACTPAIHAQAPARPAGPWARVPALPTACYSSQDQWSEQNAAALDAVQQAHYEQDEINNGIKQAASDTNEEDPMAVVARMQQAMLDDPANALKNMQEKVQKAERAQAESPALQAREQQIEAESKTLMTQYGAALERAEGPGNARLAALRKKYKVSDEGVFLWLRDGATGEPAWVRPEAHAILRQWNEAYAATCPAWWGANGHFHAYMKRYKDFLIQERIPFEKEHGDKATLEHHKTMGVASTGWRTTTDYEAAEDCMNMARSLFGQRETEPYCGPETPCR
jgi:hypothetical protein